MKTTIESIKYTTQQPNFINEWEQYYTTKKRVEKAILKHLRAHEYLFQPSHNEADKKPFKPLYFGQVENTLGLAYTSTSQYAALWVCNSGYLWATDTHYFNAFAVDTYGDIWAVANDAEENDIYIKL